MPGHDKKEKPVHLKNSFASLKKKEKEILEEVLYRNYREIYQNTERFADSLDDEIILMAADEERRSLPVLISRKHFMKNSSNGKKSSACVCAMNRWISFLRL